MMVMVFNFFLLFLDFDGTLIDPKDSHKRYISEIDYKKYNNFYSNLLKSNKDREYILCTGRSFDECKYIVSKLGFLSKKYFVSHNGSVCLVNGFKKIYENISKLIELKLLLRKFYFFLKSIFIFRFNDFDIEIIYNNIFEKKFFFQIFNNLKNKNLVLLECGSNNSFIIRTNANDKLFGIKKLLFFFKKKNKYLKNNVHIAFFGDSYNDYSALKNIDNSFCFDYCKDDIKKVSYKIIKRNEIVHYCNNMNKIINKKRL